MESEIGIATKNKMPIYKQPPRVSQSYPWLLIHHGTRNQRQTFFSISQGRYYTRLIPELYKKYVFCSSVYGWLVLEEYPSEELFLLNLCSMEMIRLPKLEMDIDVCTLTLPPGDPNSYVLFVGDDRQTCKFCRPGDQVFKVGMLEERITFETIASNGKIYALTPDNALATIEIEESTLKFKKILHVRTQDRRLGHEFMISKNYLVEISGEIFRVIKVGAGYSAVPVEFVVQKLDLPNKCWVTVQSIGANTIFIQAWGECMSCIPVESDIKRNAIYYYRLEDRNLYVFDVINRSISMQLPCPISKKNSELRWVMLPDGGPVGN